MPSDNKVTPEGRVAFEAVFSPTQFDEKAEPKFSLTLMFPKTEDLKVLQDAVIAAAREEWGSKPPAGLKHPIRDGDTMDNDMYHGHWFIRLSSKRQPGVVDQKKRPITENLGSFYSGCYARASFKTFTYNHSANKGVSFGLRHVQKTQDGEPLVSQSLAEDDFDDVPMDDDLAAMLQ